MSSQTAHRPYNPFASARLQYRAIRPQDIALYNAIGEDQVGYENSSISNIHLVAPHEAAEFMKHCAEGCLLGVAIWLPHPEGTTKEQIEELKKQDKKGGLIEEWGTAIGEIHLSRLPPDHVQHRSTEVGLSILPQHQRRGYGVEAITWATDYAFRRAGLHRVRIRAFEWNDGAIRLYEKLGFVHEGREREAFWHEGRWWDGVDMSLLEGEWREMQKGK